MEGALSYRPGHRPNHRGGACDHIPTCIDLSLPYYKVKILGFRGGSVGKDAVGVKQNPVGGEQKGKAFPFSGAVPGNPALE